MTFRMNKQWGPGTISNFFWQNMIRDNLRKNIYIYIYTYDWVTLPYSRYWHNIVNQLYLKIFLKEIILTLKTLILGLGEEL